jgi:hypothetical protein
MIRRVGVTRGKRLSLTTAERLARAEAARVVPTTGRIWYLVGAGGKDPEASHCGSRAASDGRLVADCVGFALWAYGVDRYHENGRGVMTWFNQNSIYAEALNLVGHAAKCWRFCEPYVGCLALIRGPIAGDSRVGHIGMVTGIDMTTPDGWLVTHCSPSNHRRVGQGIAETPIRPETFGKAGRPRTRPIYFVEGCW